MSDSVQRVRWRLVVPVGVAGALLVAGGGFLDPGYAQDALLGFGTALLLFGFLALAERRLLRDVRAIVEDLRTLEDAQRSVAESIRRSRHLRHAYAPDDVSRTRDVFVNRAAKQLRDAGLHQQPGAAADRLTFEDEAGLGVVWTLAWDPPGVRHELTVTQRLGTPRSIALGDPCALVPGATPEQHAQQLLAFEAAVFEGLRAVARELDGQRGRMS